MDTLAKNSRRHRKVKRNLLTLIANNPLLSDTLTTLNTTGIRYGLCSGSHVSVLTNNRRSADIDLFIHSDDLPLTLQAFPEAIAKVVGNGFSLTLGQDNDVELMGFADFFISKTVYPFRLTDTAVQNLSTYKVGKHTIQLVDPADTILLKAILQRGTDQGKRDIEDIRAIVETIDINLTYLRKRIKESDALGRVKPILTPMGIEV